LKDSRGGLQVDMNYVAGYALKCEQCSRKRPVNRINGSFRERRFPDLGSFENVTNQTLTQQANRL
jgi:hypothetical protein